MQAVARPVGAGGCRSSRSISHRFDIAEVERAYRLIDQGAAPYLGIVLRYPTEERRGPEPPQPAVVTGAVADGRAGVAVIGTGAFARAVLLPAFAAAGDRLRPELLCSARGLPAADAVEHSGFRAATASDERTCSPIPASTPCSSPPATTAMRRKWSAPLAAGKHVFVEKPLALTVEEVDRVEAALAGAGGASTGVDGRLQPAVLTRRAALARALRGDRIPAHSVLPFQRRPSRAEPLGTGPRRSAAAGSSARPVTPSTSSPTWQARLPVRVFAECVGGPAAPPVRDDQSFLGAPPRRTVRCRASPIWRAATRPFPKSGWKCSGAAGSG